MLVFCPVCGSCLTIGVGEINQFECGSCQYKLPLITHVTSRIYPKMKDLDEVLGGPGAWENAQVTEEMIRRPLTVIGLKPSDVDNMEQCLQRRFKNSEAHESEAPLPGMSRVAPAETPFRAPARRPETFAPVRERPPTGHHQPDSAATPTNPNNPSPPTSASPEATPQT